MKKFYALFIISFFIFQSERTFSQVFSLYAPDTVIYGAPIAGNDLACDGNSIVNHTANPVLLDVIRVQDVDIAGSGWQSSFCLDLNCYAPFVDSVQFTLQPNDSSLLIPHFGVTATPDSQTVYFKIKQVAAPNLTVYQRFHGITQNGFGVHEQSTYSADVNIYPSPILAGNDFNLNVGNVKSKSKELSLVVYNIYGSAVKTILYVKEGNNIMSLDFAAGMYSYSLISGGARIHSGKITVIR
jgi:hypothetical protein